MADWTDGAQYAPVERPVAFATPRAVGLVEPQRPDSPAEGQPATPPTAYREPEATPLEALVPGVESPRDPTQPFENTATDGRWGHGPDQRDPHLPLVEPEPEPAPAFPPPTGAPVVAVQAGPVAPAEEPVVLAMPLQGQYPPPTGAPVELPSPTTSGTGPVAPAPARPVAPGQPAPQGQPWPPPQQASPQPPQAWPQSPQEWPQSPQSPQAWPQPSQAWPQSPQVPAPQQAPHEVSPQQQAQWPPPAPAATPAQQPLPPRPANPFDPAPRPVNPFDPAPRPPMAPTQQQPAPPGTPAPGWPPAQPPAPQPTEVTPLTVLRESQPLALAVLAFGALVPGLSYVMLAVASMLTRRVQAGGAALTRLYSVALWIMLGTLLYDTFVYQSWPHLAPVGKVLCLAMVPLTLWMVHDELRRRMRR